VRVRHAVMALLLPVMLAGCRSGGDARYRDLEPARQALDGLTGRRCQYVSDPRVPDTLDPLTRPGTRGSLMLWARDASPADTIDLSVRYGDEGRLAWVRVLRSTVPGERAFDVARRIEGGLVDEGTPDWGVRLRLTGSRIEVLPGIICEAEQRGQTGRVAPPFATGRDVAEAQQARGRTIEVGVGLDETGRVTGVRLIRSSGSRYFDQWALEVARAIRYEPKLHDGLGVPATLPIRLRVPRR